MHIQCRRANKCCGLARHTYPTFNRSRFAMQIGHMQPYIWDICGWFFLQYLYFKATTAAANLVWEVECSFTLSSGTVSLIENTFSNMINIPGGGGKRSTATVFFSHWGSFGMGWGNFTGENCRDDSRTDWWGELSLFSVLLSVPVPVPVPHSCLEAMEKT